MKAIIFYSWQSDTRAAANRPFIQKALEAAVGELHADGSLSVEPVVDRDTQSVPGAPDIDKTILEKIDACAAMVADVTIVNSGTTSKPAPNPNVLVELGYALKSLGTRRVILVQNVAFGGPEDLPFDLRQKRALAYESPEDASSRAEKRRQLQADLKRALALVLKDADIQPAAEYPVELSMKFALVKNTLGERHDYRLAVTLRNVGGKPITEWNVDVKFPTRLLESPASFSSRVPERSNEEQTLLRATQDTLGRVIYPEDPAPVMAVDYYIDPDMYDREEHWLLDRTVTATAYVHGELAGNAELFVRDIQKF